MRSSRKKTHELTNFNAKPTLFYVVISSVIGLDKFFYPVVIYANYFVCIFMNFYANLKKDGKNH